MIKSVESSRIRRIEGSRRIRSVGSVGSRRIRDQEDRSRVRRIEIRVEVEM
jgi:hypothetical protein